MVVIESVVRYTSFIPVRKQRLELNNIDNIFVNLVFDFEFSKDLGIH